MRKAVGLLALVGLIACGGKEHRDVVRIEGPITTKDPPSTAYDTPHGDPICEPGERRCDGTLLQECLQSIEGIEWDLIDDCASAALCDAEASRCNSLDAGTDASH